MEYRLHELGYFTDTACQRIKEKLEGKTYMHFQIGWSNWANVNCVLIIKTDYDATPEEIKNTFIWLALNELARS